MPGVGKPSWERLISRLDLDVFFFGTAIFYHLIEMRPARSRRPAAAGFPTKTAASKEPAGGSTSLLFDIIFNLQAGQSAPFGVDIFLGTPAGFAIKIGATIGTQSPAIPPAQGPHRQSHEELFLNGFAEIQLFPRKGDEADIFLGKLPLGDLGGVLRYSGKPAEGQGQIHIQGKNEFFQAAPTLQLHLSCRSSFPAIEITHTAQGEVDLYGGEKKPLAPLFHFRKDRKGIGRLLKGKGLFFFSQQLDGDEQFGSGFAHKSD